MQDRGGVEAIIVVKLRDTAGLAEMLHAERRHAMAMHAAGSLVQGRPIRYLKLASKN